MKELYANSAKEEHVYLTDMVSSPGWGILKKLLRRHREYLNKAVLSHIAKDEIVEARQAAAGIAECGKLLNMVADRVAALENEITKE